MIAGGGRFNPNAFVAVLPLAYIAVFGSERSDACVAVFVDVSQLATATACLFVRNNNGFSCSRPRRFIVRSVI